MFTGIITDMGEVLVAAPQDDLRVRIAVLPAPGAPEALEAARWAPENIPLGASIACDGICLTVTARGASPAPWFEAEVSAETRARSIIGQGLWAPGWKINLERALHVGDELGGHIVSGHVDGTAQVLSLQPEGGSVRMRLRAPEAVARYIAPKGSIALNGVSLSVNEVEGAEFGVNIIPHTRGVTNLAGLAVGMPVNLEIDTIARYVARLQDWAQ